MDFEMIADASRLISLGMNPSYFGRNNEYKSLASRYRTNQEFRMTCDAVAKGHLLKIIEASDLGIYLSVTDPASPFTPDIMTVSRTCLKVESRQLIGVCILAIAAVAYERPGALGSDAAAFASVNEVYNKLVAIAEDLSTTDYDEGISEGARVILSMKQLNTSSKSEKPTIKTLHRHITDSFDFLEKQRFVKKESDREGGYYGILPRFRAQLFYGGLPATYTAVKEALAKHRFEEHEE